MATYTYTNKLNKGQLNFDGEKIIGALEGSSDGEALDTIELVPDIDQYDGDQYLVVEPNLDESRIHIRAGGTPDDSAAKLVLGGLQTHVALNDQDTDRITIRTKNTAEDGNHAWSFTSDGTVKFPLLNVDLHNGGVQAAETLQFSGESTQCVITGPTPVLDVNAQRLIIQGQVGTGTGEGGDVYLWAGDAQTNGGDIKIYAGDADSVSSGNGGYVNIDGGAGSDYGGAVAITGGSSSTGIGGNVTINGGYGPGADAGEVVVTSSSYTWTFNNDGNITVPEAKDILDGNNSLTSGGNRYKSYNSASGVNVTYTTENIILITTTGGGALATTVTLPEIKDIPIGYTFTVVDFSGGAASKNITVLPGGTDEIISVGPAASGGVIIDTNYGLVTLKNVYAGWAILYGR